MPAIPSPACRSEADVVFGRAGAKRVSVIPKLPDMALLQKGFSM